MVIKTSFTCFVPCLAALLCVARVLYCQPGGKPPHEWPVYGGNAAGTRYSPLKQINRSNVSRLKLAWSFDVSGGRGGLQTNPLVVNGIVYGNTPDGRIFAVNGANGKLIWSWNSHSVGLRGRGVTYWSAGSERRIFAGFGRYVYALDAMKGEPISGFGDSGRIDLQRDLDRDPEKESVGLSTPGIVYRDLLIVGGRNSESLPASYGDIRAYDTRTGALRWKFHTVPRPGEFGYDTWPKEAWTYTGAANDWAGMALDERRGVVYVPTGSAAADFYGANRVGNDLFANCLIALDAATGKRLWHYQVVHHDIWDRDLPSPPVLVTVKRNGRKVDAVAQATKHGYLFLFDRVSGQPLFPIEEHPFPASDVPGEVASPTQPLPTLPAPYARQKVTEDLLTNRTPEAHQWALEKFRTFRGGGQFVPLTVGQETVVFPGFDGGAEWGGQAFDAETGLLFVNASDMMWTGGLAANPPPANGRELYSAHCAACHGADLSGNHGQAPTLSGIAERRTAEEVADVVRKGSGRMPGFPNIHPPDLRTLVRFVMTGKVEAIQAAPASPFDLKYRFTGYHRFVDPEGYPAVAPPWGTLSAINLNTGAYAWKIPLGEYPELVAKGLKNTGSENYGGPIVTAGGLVFIAATNIDHKFRAFDKKTGKLLWETVMPSSGNSTPATYEINGKQYVVVAAAGGKSPAGGTAAVYVAYALQ